MRFIIGTFIIVTLGTVLAFCDTVVPAGAVGGTWNASGSPYLIEGDIEILAFDSLTIEPGVEVIFQGHYRFTVFGSLFALGTAMDSIYFYPQVSSTGWWGVRFFDAPDWSTLFYCVIENGYASTWGTEEGKGGGVYCDNSRPSINHSSFINCRANGYGGAICLVNGSGAMISNCHFLDNWADQKGGAVNCENSNPTIRNCLIEGSETGDDGGAIACWQNSSPVIQNNIIKENIVYDSGGGIFCFYAEPQILDNYILSNSCENYGAGIYLEESPASIIGNVISGNSDRTGIWCWNNSHSLIMNNLFYDNLGSFSGGGGLRISGSAATVTGNYFIENSASSGGGVWSGGSNSLVYEGNVFAANVATNGNGGAFSFDNWGMTTVARNTFYQNSAASSGGGISGGVSGEQLKNDIFWNNTASSNPQINGPWDVSYCDVSGGWTGIGNIDQYPMFVDTAHYDFRLRWGSPCIDAGDPDPFYTDPDSTTGDIGAHSFYQSIPVRVLLTPHERLNVIPGTGGSIDFTIWVDNIDNNQQPTTIWCDITRPDGTIYGPVIGPVTFNLPAGFSGDRLRIQNVPEAAPWGVYRFNAYAVAGSDTSSDSFTFAKTGSESLYWSTGWDNEGEEFDNMVDKSQTSIPCEYTLSVYPNPFNPVTVISYKLQVASSTSLTIYDVQGRQVTELVDGWRDSGLHEITFDASQFTSGIYFCKLVAGNYHAVQKMVLVK